MKKQLMTLAAVIAAAFTSSANSKEAVELPGLAAQPAIYFYSGKPYDADLGAYVFNFRNYNDVMNRWTTADPSGFSDGPNLYRYAPVPCMMVDPNGLWSVKLTSSSASDSWSNDVFYDGWLWGNDYLEAGGAIVSDTDPDTLVSSITVSANAYARWRDEGNPQGLQNSFTISVSGSGSLTVSGTGDTNAGTDLTLAIAANKDLADGGKTLTLTYDIAALYNPEGLTGVGGSILGNGGNFSWDRAGAQLSGMVSFVFEAVE